MPSPSIVTPGNHDGVHLGHRALVHAARARAAGEGLRTLAMFFDPHPTSVLAPERAPTLLTTPTRRAGLLRSAGADDVLVLPFDQTFASMSPEAFVEEVLVSRCAARGVVVGPDFHFGHKRTGNIDTLRALGHVHGFDVTVVEPVMVEGSPSSSTRIRACLREGDVTAAATMLARLHEVEGVVVEGDKRGRTIGFPTANLADICVQCPADGVYAVVVRVLERDAPLLFGVANVGVRPTMAAGRSFEVHVFDFEGDLYGARLRVGLAQRLRGEQRFSSLDALVAQIGADVGAARAALTTLRQEWLTWL
jgi:riboflavin kinase/FMN adenylyltransferase